ncbi:MAG: hypothetical protein SPJ80_02700 [Bacilli bacterium]|nr:hypothetical protein [Bacilli bacterium]
MDMGMGMGGGVGVWRMVGRGRKEKDLMVGQISFLCVLLLRRQDGWFCAKLDGWAWAATFGVVI